MNPTEERFKIDCPICGEPQEFRVALDPDLESHTFYVTCDKDSTPYLLRVSKQIVYDLDVSMVMPEWKNTTILG